MDDIIFSTANQNDDGTWYQSNYWRYSRGKRTTYSVDTYADGDHEDIRAKDLPTYEEVNASWLEYSQFVLETGTDPLGEFYVKRTVTQRQRWQFKFSRSIVGPVLVAARRAGKVVAWRDLPAHVLEYLNVDPKGCAPRLRDFASWEEFAEGCEGVRPHSWITHHVEVKVARPAATVARELRAIARRHLARNT